MEFYDAHYEVIRNGDGRQLVILHKRYPIYD